MNTILKNAGAIILAVMIVFFVSLFVWYGKTEVAFKIQDDTLYRQIKNGRVGANCYDENGVKVIAPSRVAGPDWMPVASLGDIPEDGKIYSITCYPYASISDAPPVNATIHLAGMR